MSFLNSVLSSIGGGAGQSQSQSGRAAPSQTPATKPTQTPRVGGPSNGVSSTSVPKRKAEGEPASVPAKAARKDVDTSRSTPVSRTGTASPVVKPAAPASTSSVPYRGTAQPSGSAAARKPTTYASVAKSGASASSAAKPAPKPVAKPPPAVAAVQAPSGPAPKKGSYQEILARAKAAQQATPPVGAIKHKPVERLSKKEKLALDEKNKLAAAAAKDPKLGQKQSMKPGMKGPIKGADAKAGEAAKEKRKAPDLGYQGTMRPAAKEPVYQGTMNKGSAVARRPGLDRGERSRSGSLGPRPTEKRYRYVDEEDEEDDYDSEGSSDMEAGIFDVDQEEQMSLRVARKEDEEALREEEELKRKKLERKQMLERMNSQAKKKRAY